MKRINVFLFCLAMVITTSFIASCSNENVYSKKISAIEQATAKIPAANVAAELIDINTVLENELEAIDKECVEELDRIAEDKINNAEAYKNEEEALEKAQSAYDDAFIERMLALQQD